MYTAEERSMAFSQHNSEGSQAAWRKKTQNGQGHGHGLVASRA